MPERDSARRGWSTRAVAGLLALALVPACAAVQEKSSLRAVPLEPPRTVQVEAGTGLGVSGEREGQQVRVQVNDLRYCAKEQLQRAEGFRRIERQAIGHSLTMQWLFGGLFTATGAGLAAYNAARPPDETVSLRSESSGYVYAGGIAAIGAVLLAGSLYQQLGLGVHETPVGERVLTRRTPPFVCGRAHAKGGQVRLTLPDGTQLEAQADDRGVAVVDLPADVEAILEREQSRRATLEAIGDARAQVRIRL